MSVRVKVPGRVCLLGDKNDMLNGPVIAAAISKFFYFDISKIDGDTLKFHHRERGEDFERPINENVYNEFFKFLSQIAWRLRDRISAFEVFVSGDLPISSGLSSSAACSVGMIRALSELFDLKMETKEIAELAFQVERYDLEIMCGRMDQYSIAYEGATFIETGEMTRVTPIDIKSITIVIGDSAEPRKAAAVLNHTMDMINCKDPEFMDCFRVINENVIHGKEALEQHNLPRLGELMNIHQKMEERMDASTPKLMKMCSDACGAGAYGAKQIGAGGGGCMIALCDDDNADAVIEAVEKAGGIAWRARIYSSD